MEQPQDADQARCRAEIAHIEEELRAGNPDVQGLLLALHDWRQELELARSGT
jgi:hypothetical protein